MSRIIFTIIFFVGFCFGISKFASAEGLGPVGPKTSTGNEPGSQTPPANVNLPYKPAGDEIKKPVSKSSHKEKPESEPAVVEAKLIEPPKVERVIPYIPSKTIVSVGAPDAE